MIVPIEDWLQLTRWFLMYFLNFRQVQTATYGRDQITFAGSLGQLIKKKKLNVLALSTYAFNIDIITKDIKSKPNKDIHRQ